MTLKLLLKISKQTLPFTVTDLDEIDKLKVLRAAGHLAALLPSCNAKPPVRSSLGYNKERVGRTQRPRRHSQLNYSAAMGMMRAVMNDR